MRQAHTIEITKHFSLKYIYVFQTLSDRSALLSCPYLPVLSSMPRGTCLANLSRIPCLDFPAPGVMSRMSCHGCPAIVVSFQLTRPLSCHCWHVTVVSFLSCPRCSCPVPGLVPAVLSQLSCPSCPVPAVLSQLSCPSCPSPAVLLQHSFPLLSCRHAVLPRCHVLAVLSTLSCPG
jgi:hypothetical protein